MNLLLLEPAEVRGRRALIGGRRRAHVGEVLRAREGEALRVGVLGGNCGTATLVRLDEHEAELELALETPPPPPLPCTLVLALQRPHTLGKVLQAVAAMGVKRIFLLGGARVEKSYWQSRAVAAAEMRRHLVLGLEQGRDTILPEVALRQRFRPFAEDELPALAAGRSAFVAHPGATLACPRGPLGETLLAVGPEGGFTDFEIELLGRAGLAAVGLGPRPLRTEHAVPALLGRLF